MCVSEGPFRCTHHVFLILIFLCPPRKESRELPSWPVSQHHHPQKRHPRAALQDATTETDVAGPHCKLSTLFQVLEKKVNTSSEGEKSAEYLFLANTFNPSRKRLLQPRFQESNPSQHVHSSMPEVCGYTGAKTDVTKTLTQIPDD